MLRQFDRLLDAMSWLAIAIILASTVAVTVDVIARSFFHYSFLGVVELTEYGLLFLTFLGSAWLLREKGHVRVEVIVQRMRPKTRAVFEIISNLIGMASTLIITYFGTSVTVDFYLRNVRTATVLELPRAFLFFIIPLGSFLLAIQFGRNLLKEVERFNSAHR